MLLKSLATDLVGNAHLTRAMPLGLPTARRVLCGNVAGGLDDGIERIAEAIVESQVVGKLQDGRAD